VRTPRNRRQPHSPALIKSQRRLERRKQLTLLLETVEQERANLARAESLLGCLKIAMEYEGQSAMGPYYPDVAEIARELVGKSVNALDPIYLPSPPRGKVREEFRAGHFTQLCMPIASTPVVEGAQSRVRPPPFASAPMMATIPRNVQMRLHRRVYSCESIRAA
jgi:hypothetical protein